MIVLESLQMAQMVADLSALEAARNDRARALLQANKEADAAAATAAAAAAAASAPATPATDVPAPTTADDPSRPTSANRRVASATSLFTSASANGTASPFDSYLGRFLSPALTRANSSHGTGINTPQSSAPTSDVDRAHSMVALHELRAKLKQYNDSASLRQARDKVAALTAQRQAGEQAAAAAAASAATGPTSDPAPTQQHSQYTFPRA